MILENEKRFFSFYSSFKNVQCNLMVNLTMSMTVTQFNKGFYIFFLCVKNTLAKLLGLLHDCKSLTISIAAILTPSFLSFIKGKIICVFPEYINCQEQAVQRLKLLLACDMRNHAFTWSKKPRIWCRKTPGQQDQEFTIGLQFSY